MPGCHNKQSSENPNLNVPNQLIRLTVVWYSRATNGLGNSSKYLRSSGRVGAWQLELGHPEAKSRVHANETSSYAMLLLASGEFAAAALAGTREK
jgi:hypothetical protein